MSNFKKDLENERILGLFLSKQYEKANINHERLHQLDLQMLGIDLLIKNENGLTFKVDEKAQLHYLNKDLPTFALEISYFKNENLRFGWLYDSHKLTEIYAFVFSIFLRDLKTILRSENDIKSCEVVFVNRISLLNELAKLGIDLKLCQEMSFKLRGNTGYHRINHSSGFNFQISKHLAEQPVNLIVKRSFLERNGKLYKFEA